MPRCSPLPITDGSALRRLESASRTERWLNEHESHTAMIAGMFCDLEEDFFTERAGADADPNNRVGGSAFYDEWFLNLYRRDLANELLRTLKPKFHAFIRARAVQEIEFPPLREQKPDAIDVAVEQRFKEKEHAHAV